ncbi:hypothetical protein CAOG_03178 [Capsaspora owczarzaki ATCC 30864]|uniref:Metallo-beta-lactamase domain-containing protein n=1 Tax=Capsaspora owczarzaki (strain ATCC 30864) TaxID=595528 RepID=A0A0D2X293_CAPO3|nr:hypothetical protein CAOG_03178 [Capsaspora owczarzaki ATCC 30864]KJE92159.1 hypothetical protein CAOG_003178 [Capsaspora owczarzaki ATCC 30864]|eukprot:XP_004364017.2 hypothetical protein CAOG_03178 [Capsaspora owczarzaki ATCC 30864]
MAGSEWRALPSSKRLRLDIDLRADDHDHDHDNGNDNADDDELDFQQPRKQPRLTLPAASRRAVSLPLLQAQARQHHHHTSTNARDQAAVRRSESCITASTSVPTVQSHPSIQAGGRALANKNRGEPHRCPICQYPFPDTHNQQEVAQRHVQGCMDLPMPSTACRYGVECRHRHPRHFHEFSHHPLAEAQSLRACPGLERIATLPAAASSRLALHRDATSVLAPNVLAINSNNASDSVVLDAEEGFDSTGRIDSSANSSTADVDNSAIAWIQHMTDYGDEILIASQDQSLAESEGGVANPATALSNFEFSPITSHDDTDETESNDALAVAVSSLPPSVSDDSRQDANDNFSDEEFDQSWGASLEEERMFIVACDSAEARERLLECVVGEDVTFTSSISRISDRSDFSGSPSASLACAVRSLDAQEHPATPRRPHEQSPTPFHHSSTLSSPKASPASSSRLLLQQGINAFFQPLRSLSSRVASAVTPALRTTVSSFTPKSSPAFSPSPARASTMPVAATSASSSSSTNSSFSSSSSSSSALAAPSLRPRFSAAGASKAVRPCPFYKRMPDTTFVVDAFRFGRIAGCTGYFLTHFHSDHYGGLSKGWRHGPIYCSEATANLAVHVLGVADDMLHRLPMDREVTVDGVGVTLIDANHCPGSCLIKFVLPDGRVYLHTGDFRADPAMLAHQALAQCRFAMLYLDTTYCDPRYTFPSQQEVVSFCARISRAMVVRNSRLLVVVGTYQIGKEKVFQSIAKALGVKAAVDPHKLRILQCLNNKELSDILTLDKNSTRLHILPLFSLSAKSLQAYLSNFRPHYNAVLAFRPTGWTFSSKLVSVADIQPQITGNICMYGVPYSEHSSFSELGEFVAALKATKVIPTVNIGSAESRARMENHIRSWMNRPSRWSSNTTAV